MTKNNEDGAYATDFGEELKSLRNKQKDCQRTISKFVANLKKTGKASRSKGFLEGKLNLLEGYWKSFYDYHLDIVELLVDADDDEYFTSDVFSQVEIMYSEAIGFVKDELAAFNIQPQETQFAAQGNNRMNIDREIQQITPGNVTLPKIQIPKFDGSYLSWTAFKDLYTSLIGRNASLTDVQRLHYLKNSLSGEAEEMLRNVTVTAANYDSAWATLTKHYENKRALINALFYRLTSVPPIAKESAIDLKGLLFTTTQTIAALKNMNRPTDQWDDWLVYTTVQRFDRETRKHWENEISEDDELPGFQDVEDFLLKRVRTLEAVECSRSNTSAYSSESNKNRSSNALKPPSQANASKVKSFATSTKKCQQCGKSHFIAFCHNFRRQPVSARRELVAKEGLCFNCLNSDHQAINCSKSNCRICNQRHNTLLHSNDTNMPTGTEPLPTTTNQQSSTAVDVRAFVANRQSSVQRVLLATAIVNVRAANGAMIVLRALLDQGSQTSFISESAVQLLRLPKTRVNVGINGISAGSPIFARAKVKIDVSSCYDAGNTFTLEPLVLTKLTTQLPESTVSVKDWPHLAQLSLADPQYNRPAKIDLLLGADIYATLLADGIRIGEAGAPCAQNTKLGWILSGPIRSSFHTIITSFHAATEDYTQLDQQLRRFWEVESIPDRSLLTDDERLCEDIFQSTHRRNSDGRYVVRLPVIDDLSDLGESRTAALNRLRHMERKFERDPELHRRYREFMQSYQDLGHMRLAPQKVNTVTFFLPHHAVFKESSTSTKLRVVFDASQKTTKGLSLNDKLHVGQKLQQNLLYIILRWRVHQIVMSADVEKMFRQILVDEQDVSMQRILWRNSQRDPVNEYDLLTVTYGTACAPFLAIRTLRQLAYDEKQRFPEASDTLLTSCYVDDILTGAHNISSAMDLQGQLIRLLKSGGFTLKKWTSNRSELLSHLPADFCETSTSLAINEGEREGSVSALGLRWSPSADVFSYEVNIQINMGQSITKRAILSTIAKLFDPLGWISPIVIRGKIIMQRIWLSGMLWDDIITNRKILSMWQEYSATLSEVTKIQIPRWYGVDSTVQSIQIHGFSDASIDAYAAAVYIRLENGDGTVKVKLVAAKTKVAPVKQLSLPRLELSGALLLVRLLSSVSDALNLRNPEMFGWTDSTVVLSWLADHPTRWKTFIANRVSEIQDTLPPSCWYHVPSEQNPADCASRGMTPSQLLSHAMWLQGPEWLQLDRHHWPLSNSTAIENEEILEERKVMAATTSGLEVLSYPGNIIQKVSNLGKLVRIMAYILRFVANTRLRGKSTKLRATCHPPTTSECKSAMSYCVRIVQKFTFASELSCLRNQQNLPRSSALVRLAPFIDSDDVIRIGGRLRHSSLSFDEAHPIIIPKANELASLIIANAHSVTMHGGTQLTLSYIRQKYWLLDGRNQVRQFIHKCVRCYRYSAKPNQQQMADLPHARVTPSRPFLHCGVDYAGPIFVRTSKGRGYRANKAYISVFVCFSTRAVHLELVSDLSSQAFIAAYKRFSSRRGIAAHLYSDQGTNFKGADSELRSVLKDAIHANNAEIHELLHLCGTQWHFNPPNAPHHGGIWEAAVKSTKYHIKRVVGEHKFTFEEMNTYLATVEACLNSRPIAPLTDDPQDLAALTPGHFLIGAPLRSIPHPDLQNSNEKYITRWKLVEKLQQDFWKRWSMEYLNTLQQRNKWQQHKPQVKVGELVLLRGDHLPPCAWALGRVLAVHPGPDNLVRVVSIKTQSGEYMRPITKICVLPIDQRDTVEPAVDSSLQGGR